MTNKQDAGVSLDKAAVLKYYSRKDIQNAIVEQAKNKEIAVKYSEGFGKRPDVLNHPGDVLEFARQGAVSFHCSEELWHNPLLLKTDMKKRELDELRSGWDLIIDIDGYFDYSMIAADLIIKALKYHGIESITCKFSGNKGLHIAVPFEAFPKKIHDKEILLWFPDGAKSIALYLKEMIKEYLVQRILKFEDNDLKQITEKTGKKFKEIVKDNNFDPFSLLDIDTLLISSRHLYRMPYSINEKSGLVSIPVDINKLHDFKKDAAKMENVITKIVFLDRENARPNEARQLFVQAFDFSQKSVTEIKKEKKEFEAVQGALPEEVFPACIKKILEGMADGRKRSVFILTNFLTSVGWDYGMIEKRLQEWNKKNTEPLRETYINGQLRYHKSQKKKILPPNCANKSYYADLGFCIADSLCSRIKNPVNYAIIKAKGRRK